MPNFIVNNKWYGWDAPERTLRQAKQRMLILVIVNAVLSLACGLIPTGVTRHNWVSFAATAALIALGAELVGVIRFYRAKSMLYQREFQNIDYFVKLSTLFHMMLTGVAVIACLVSVIQSWTGLLDLLVLAGLLCTGLCSFFIWQTYRDLPTLEMKNLD